MDAGGGPASESAAPSPLEENEGEPSSIPTQARPPGPNESGGLQIRWTSAADAEAPSIEVSDSTAFAALPKDARRSMDASELQVEFVAALDGSPFHLAQVSWGPYQSTLMVVNDRGKVIHKVHIRQRSSDVGLIDLLGDRVPEVAVSVIDGFELSYYPRSMVFYRITKNGKLVRVAKVPASLGYGAKCTRYVYRNEVSVPDKGQIRVVNVYTEPSLDEDEYADEKKKKKNGERGSKTRSAEPDTSFELTWSRATRQFSRTELPHNASDPRQSGCDSPNGKARRSFGPF